jgi:integration host factor subunit alpha
MVLTKADLIKKLMQGVRGLSRQDATSLVELFFAEISATLIQGEEVKLSGFGNFSIRDKKSRPGRNPKTGETVAISARRVVTFHPSHKLKEKITKMMQEQK